MRTLIVILIGLALLVVLEIVSRGIGKHHQKDFNAPIIFLILWSIFIIVDIYFGVRAGYGLVEELMIHAVIFAVPAAAAWSISRR